MPERASTRPERALIFDMDGVLIDSEPLWRRAEIEIFGAVGLRLSEADCYQTQGLRIDEAVAYWFERAPWTGTACGEVAERIVSRMTELIRSEGEPLPGVHASIEAAQHQGWRLGLASSSAGRLIDTVLERFGLSEVFECTRSAELEAQGKPHPAVYLSTARELALAPDRCVAIEDSIHGVTSALAAGMQCIAVPAPESRSQPEFDRATRRLDTLEALPDVLLELDATMHPEPRR